jgi:hypothetical protein
MPEIGGTEIVEERIMKCEICGAMVPDDAADCPSCGISRSEAVSSPIDRIANDTAQAIRDAVQVVKSVQKVGDEVADAGRRAATAARSSKTRVGKAWTATKTLMADEERKGRATVRHARAKGRDVQRKATEATHHVTKRARSVVGKIGSKGKTVQRKAAVAGHRAEDKVRAAARKARSAARRASR